tara:strand:+ start:425 stop:946 length:522 start_codon:yes stop_codon:yes gene_type:complete
LESTIKEKLMPAKKKIPLAKCHKEAHRKMVEASANDMLTRCRALNVGAAGGGITEISMRSNEGYYSWSHLQPVEVVELIHQLAGQVGCHIAIQPRKDFSSWREWNITDEEQKHFAPFAPQPDMRGLMTETAMQLPPAKEQPGLNSKLMAGEKDAVAIKKTVRRKAAKRTRRAS